MPALTSKKYRFAFILITSLFFLWGFIHNLDPILIAQLKKSFTLTVTQSTLVDSAVYIAYFLMALPAGFIMKKFGYKTGIIIGLLLFATGCLLFIPAANMRLYPFFLGVLFIVACGLTILETAANPYADSLGPTETSTQRLNLAQSFNGLAAFVAPLIGSKVILTDSLKIEDLNAMTPEASRAALAAEASSVKTPFLILGSILLLVAVIFAFTKMPPIETKDEGVKSKNILHAFKYKHLSWAVAAQFFYVGAQVSIFSLFLLYAPKAAGITQKDAVYFLSLCGLAFLIGRFLGTFLMKFIQPQTLLALYAVINVLLCLVVMKVSGMITVYAVIGICFFMSVMFPTIFSLGIKNLGGDTEYGSSLLIMSIVGGAVFPRFFGYIGDKTHNIQYGLIVPIICFVVIAYFGLRGYRVRQRVVADDVLHAPVLPL